VGYTERHRKKGEWLTQEITVGWVGLPKEVAVKGVWLAQHVHRQEFSPGELVESSSSFCC